VSCKNKTLKTIVFKPVTLKNGDVFVSYEDVTELQRYETKLRQSHTELEQAYGQLKMLDMAKERVINHLSHELKTPLALLSGVFRILETKLSAESDHSITKTIRRGERSIQRLIDIQKETEDIFYAKAYNQSRRIDNLIEDLLAMREEYLEQNPNPLTLLDYMTDRLAEIFGCDDSEVEDIHLGEFLSSMWTAT